jgi:hypothetical protein
LSSHSGPKLSPQERSASRRHMPVDEGLPLPGAKP